MSIPGYDIIKNGRNYEVYKDGEYICSGSSEQELRDGIKEAEEEKANLKNTVNKPATKNKYRVTWTVINRDDKGEYNSIEVEAENEKEAKEKANITGNMVRDIRVIKLEAVNSSFANEFKLYESLWEEPILNGGETLVEDLSTSELAKILKISENKIGQSYFSEVAIDKANQTKLYVKVLGTAPKDIFFNVGSCGSVSLENIMNVMFSKNSPKEVLEKIIENYKNSTMPDFIEQRWELIPVLGILFHKSITESDAKARLDRFKSDGEAIKMQLTSLAQNVDDFHINVDKSFVERIEELADNIVPLKVTYTLNVSDGSNDKQDTYIRFNIKLKSFNDFKDFYLSGFDDSRYQFYDMFEETLDRVVDKINKKLGKTGEANKSNSNRNVSSIKEKPDMKEIDNYKNTLEDAYDFIQNYFTVQKKQSFDN